MASGFAEFVVLCRAADVLIAEVRLNQTPDSARTAAARREEHPSNHNSQVGASHSNHNSHVGASHSNKPGAHHSNRLGARQELPLNQGHRAGFY